MAKKVKHISKNTKDQLRGFEDVVDLVLGDIELKEKGEAKLSKAKYESFEVSNFLEIEFIRLSLIERFYSEKIPNLKANPQTQNLIVKQKDTRDLIKSEIIEKALAPTSDFVENLSEVFNQAFKSK